MENKSVEMSIEDRIKERKEKAKVRAMVTKDKICELYDMLSFTRITFNKIEVKYAGSGDSGAIEDMDFIKDDKILFSKFVGYSHEPQSVSFPQDNSYSEEDKKEIPINKTLNSLITYLEDIVYDMLEERHCGLEINEGQEGTFTFTFGGAGLKEVSIGHDYTVFTSESYQYEEEY